MKKNHIDKYFSKFLNEYLENVKRELPYSYRATQLRTGDVDAELVFQYETIFLKGPFIKALTEYSKQKEDIDFAIIKEQMKSIKSEAYERGKREGRKEVINKIQKLLSHITA